MEQDDSESDLAAGAEDSFEALLRSVARTPQALRPGDTLADGRFTIAASLGQGGMGTVYEAHDAQRGGTVALKTLTGRDPERAYRLKHEFRSLCDVAHDNLVVLHEFFATGEPWFFTMDRVHGQDFRSHVRPDSRKRCDVARLRHALAQLAQGVVALHNAGKLHCDLKPGNVLVSEEGKLTILDFGLVSEQALGAVGHTLGPQPAGTAGYMAPEQTQGRPLSTATDYYAVGVMLFEALTGRKPVGADAARPPDAVDVPHDLLRLSRDLCAPDPEQRPDPQAFVARCGATGANSSVSLPTWAPGPLVGRKPELERLSKLHASLEAGKPHVVVVSGSAGMGKSRLCREWLAEPTVQGSSIILSGRCADRERVPFNAFDGVMDACSRYLHRLPDEQSLALLPPEARTLGEAFPVLMRLPTFKSAPYGKGGHDDPQDQRQRAFGACKFLLRRLSDRAPLVLYVDDLQDADSDSLQLLSALLAAPDAPTMLLLGAYRPTPHKPLHTLQSLCTRAGATFTDLGLNPLTSSAAHRLLAERVTLGPEAAQSLIAQGEGNPSLLLELIAAAGDSEDAETLSADALLLRRATGLPAAAQSLLGLLALARAPMELEPALRMVGLGDDPSGMLTRLRNARLVRVERSAGIRSLELYHERLATVLVQRIDEAEQRRWHRALATHFEQSPHVPAQVVAEHLRGALEHGRAALYFVRAATDAEGKLAFDSAARWYRAALSCRRFDPALRFALRLRLAEALRQAGHGRWAAGVYLQAAACIAQPFVGLFFQRKAVQLLLENGSLEEGNRTLRALLSRVGLEEPREGSDFEAQLTQAQHQLSAAGIDATSPLQLSRSERPEPGSRERADACWAASALGPYDVRRAHYFATVGLRWALQSGDRARIARALLPYATGLGARGDIAFARRLLAGVQTLGTEGEYSAPLALVSGQLHLFAGDLAPCIEDCDRALGLFSARPSGTDLETLQSKLFAHMALHLSGQLTELVGRSRQELAKARQLGHRFWEATVRVLGVGLGHLVDDEPDLARRQAEISAALWPQSQFHAERFKVLRLQVWCDLYEGLATRAHGRCRAARSQVARSGLLDSAYWRAWWHDLEAAVTLAAAAQTHDAERRAALVPEAERAIAHLTSLRAHPLELSLHCHQAGLQALQGDLDGAQRSLEALCSAPHPVVAACAKLRLGQGGDGAQDAALAREGLAALAEQVRSPEKWAAWLLPDFGHLNR